MAGTPVRPGDANIAGTPLVNFLKVFAGEVLTAFEETNVMQPIVQTRTITQGKVAQFINTAKADALYHTAGVNIIEGTLTSNIATNERLIYVDNKLISAVLLDNLDEAMAHWDARSAFATELGRAIAKRYDQLALNTAILAARAASNLTAGAGSDIPGGTTVTDANLGTQGQALINALFAAAQAMDQNDVPKTDRYAVITPAMFYNLIRDPSVQLLYTQSLTNLRINMTPDLAAAGTNAQLSAVAGSQAGIQSNYPMIQQGLADWGQGTIRGAAVAGFTVLVSNHLPNGLNIASNDAFFGNTAATMAGYNGNVYHGDFTNTRGVCFHRSALGVVKLRDLAVETDYKIEYQGNLLVAKLMCGMGKLRPEAAVELKVA